MKEQIILKKVPFCVCTDVSCPNHPENHSEDCTLCIAKNLRKGEIPSCFFFAVGALPSTEGYSYEAFAKAVMKRKDEDRL